MSFRPRSTVVALLAVAALGLSLVPAGALPLVTTTEQAFAPQLVTVDAPTRAHRNAIADLGLDVTEHAGHDYVEVVLHSAADEALLAANGFTWDVRIGDLIAREMERIELDAAFAAANPVTDLPSGRNAYRVLADFGNEIDQLAADNPDLAKRITIGTSVEGRDLTGIEIGVDVNEPEDGRPVFLMFGAHHAREWPSAELPMEFAHDLIDAFTDSTHPDHARVVDLLTRGRAIIVPVSNPDGYDASRTSGAVDLNTVVPQSLYNPVTILGTPGNAYKRKNCRYVDGQSQPAGTCVLAASPGGLGIGVDLNRNYGGLWGGPGASGESTSATYRGPAPFSEPETQAIRNLISTRQVTTLISNHTFSNLILRPVGVNPATVGPDGSPIGFAPDECFTAADGHDHGMQALGERMAAQNGYSNQFGWELYDTTGTTEDYSYNATGGYGYTFEIGAHEFHPPYEEVIAEYLGTTSHATNVDGDNAAELTTAAGDACEGAAPTHTDETVGGGNREAYLIAFENAVNSATHAVLTGTAPAGAEITVSRTGTFPLWDGTPFEDTVTTSMTVDETGEFTYHVNPSTRPFVDSRKASQLGEPVAELQATGTAPPLRSSTQTLVIDTPVDLIRATVNTSFPVDGQAVRYNEMHLQLLGPNGQPLASATEFGPTNSLLYSDPEGKKLPAGTYTLRVSNSLAVTSQYDLEAYAQDVVAPVTTRTPEMWTVSCDGVEVTRVLVDRGETVDLNTVC